MKLLHQEALLTFLQIRLSRLGDEASKDPERKVQEAAIETAKSARPKEREAASKCMLVFNWSGLINRLYVTLVLSVIIVVSDKYFF